VLLGELRRNAIVATLLFLAAYRFADRLLAIDAEGHRFGARFAIEGAPALERFDAGVVVAVAGGVARARLFYAATGANTERVLLHKLGELISHAAEGGDTASTAERARGR